MADEIIPEKPQNKLPDNPEQIEAKKISILSRMEKFSGPLPPPVILEHYNKIIPDGANRILKLVEQQQTHRHHLEKTVIEGDVKRSDRGLILGFIIALVISVGGMILIAIGCDISGLSLILGGIVTLTGIFVYSKKVRKQDLEDHKDSAPQKTPEQTDLF